MHKMKVGEAMADEQRNNMSHREGKSSESEIKDSYRDAGVASQYVSVRFASELNRLLHDRQLAAVQRVFQDLRPASSLEIAPGPGRLTRDVRPTGQLTCLEYNAAMIAEGQAACGPEVIWRQGDAFALPFENEFQFVYSFRFIRHFHRADRDRLYAQIHQVLRPGGYLVVDAVNAQVSGPLRTKCPGDYPIYDKLYRDERELRDEMQAAGFEVVRVVPVQRWFGLQSKLQNLLGPRSRTLCWLAVRGLEALSRGPALEWIVTCRRG